MCCVLKRKCRAQSCIFPQICKSPPPAIPCKVACGSSTCLPNYWSRISFLNGGGAGSPKLLRLCKAADSKGCRVRVSEATCRMTSSSRIIFTLASLIQQRMHAGAPLHGVATTGCSAIVTGPSSQSLSIVTQSEIVRAGQSRDCIAASVAHW